MSEDGGPPIVLSVPRSILDRAEEEVTDATQDIDKTFNWIDNADPLDPQFVQKLTGKMIGLKAKIRVIQLLVTLKGLGHTVAYLRVQETLINILREQLPFVSHATAAKLLESITKAIAGAVESTVTVVGGNETMTDDMLEAFSKEMGVSASEFEDMTPEARERVRQALDTFFTKTMKETE